MATVTVGTTATTLDTGGSGFLRVANTGNRQATVVRGTDRTVLWPNCSTTITPNGVAVTATTPSGTTTLDTATGNLDAGLSGTGAIAGDDLSADAMARLEAAFASNTKARFTAGRHWMFSGTSITAGSNASNVIYSYVFQALGICGSWYASRGSFQGGTPGTTVAAQLADLPARLAANPPNALFIEPGPNDASDATATTLASFATSVAGMVTLGKAAGLPVVVATPTPRTTATATATTRLRTAQQAGWIRLWAQTAGVQVADFNAALSDPTTGDLLAAYASGDGLHPNTAGHERLAQVAADAMRAALPPVLHYPVTAKGAGLATNPLMVSGGTTPTGSYAETATGDAPTLAMEADTTGRLPAGQWAKETWTTVASAVTYNRPISVVAGGASTWQAGDVVALSAYVEVTDAAARWEADVAAGTAAVMVSTRASGVNFVHAWDASPGRRLGSGVYSLGPSWSIGTIPAGGLQDITYWVKLPVGAAITARFGCVDVFNLTKLGLTAEAASPVTV